MSLKKSPDLSGADLSGMRLLISESLAMDDLEKDPGQSFENCVRILGRAGAKIERKPLPMVSDTVQLLGSLYAPEAYGQWKDQIEAAPEKMFPEILNRFRAGRDVSAPEFVAAWID